MFIVSIPFSSYVAGTISLVTMFIAVSDLLNIKSMIEELEAEETQLTEEIKAEYDALLKNSSAALPAAVVTEIGKKMESPFEEIRTLGNTEPPEEHTVDSAFA